MNDEIFRKLTAELESGISTEAQVVYVLAGVRKVIERDNLGAEYRTLKFHCDWALHASLDRGHAKEILTQWDTAHPLLMRGIELSEMPANVRTEIDAISKLRRFKWELDRFFESRNLPPLTHTRSDGWVHFLHLY